MKQYVITVARQFGSLGRPIAQKLSELLGVEYFDRDIVDAAAKKMNLAVSDISSQEEIAKGAFAKMGFPLGLGTTMKQDEIYDVQARIIRDLAEKKSCIIVGRCSDYILRNQKNAIHVFIYAPYEDRIRNCVDTLHMTKEEAKSRIQEVDKARDAYHKHYTKFLPSDPAHKDIMINSSLLGVEGTAQALADIIRMKLES